MAIGDIDRARKELDVRFKDYREAAGDYAEYLKRARERFEREEVVTVRQVREVYKRAARRIRDAVGAVTLGTLREHHMLALAKALEEQAEALRGQLNGVLRSGIQLAVDLAVEPAERITLETAGEVLDRAGIRAMFQNINQRAVTALLSRTRGDGLRLSDRIWRVSRSWQRATSRVIEDMVAQGLNSREAARYIDRYLQPQTHTVLKTETRRRLGVPRDVSMEAMRLAVTEMNNAFHEGTILAGRATPSYQGIHWRLSHAHVVPDICDKLAEGSPYPKGQEPEKPHPWCRCVAIQVHEDTQAFMQRLREWVNNPESQPDLERWYNEYAKPFFSGPAVRFVGGGGGRAGSGGSGGRGGGGGWSDHPVDRLIRNAVNEYRKLNEQELRYIIKHVATRPLDDRVVRVKGEIRRLPGKWKGTPFTDLLRLSLAEIHLIERTVMNQQWPLDTTLEQYIYDLWQAVKNAEQIYTYTFNGQPYIGFLASNHVKGPNSEPFLWVAYSAAYGVIRTGYQVTKIEEIFRNGFPIDWLKQR